MHPSLLPRLLIVAALAIASLLGGCGMLDDKKDETAGWSANKLYGEAKDSMAGRDWEKAIKYLEKLEARYPYGRYAQQAQLEVAYANWKSGERASMSFLSSGLLGSPTNGNHVFTIVERQ